jgi:hypothetical protein
MGIFDPAFKKILARSPGYFQQSALLWGPMIEVAIIQYNLTKAANVFRAAVIGNFALKVAEDDQNNWSLDSLNYITRITSNAMTCLPSSVHPIVMETVAAFSQNEEKS